MFHPEMDPDALNLLDSDLVSSNQEDLSDYQLTRDRVIRDVKPPFRYAHADVIAYALNIENTIEFDEPLTFTDACRSKDKSQWFQAMQEEMDSFQKNNTWTLVQRSPHQKVIGCGWIFKRKLEILSAKPAWFKARVVAKGYSQVEGIDYHEVFSPVVKHTSIRLVLAMVALYDLELEQLELKTIFLHGNLEEMIFIEQPIGFVKKGVENLVCQFQRSLYSLKQSPKQQYKRFDEFMIRK